MKVSTFIISLGIAGIASLFGGPSPETTQAFLPVLATLLLGGLSMYSNYQQQSQIAKVQKQQAELDRQARMEQERIESQQLERENLALMEDQKRLRASQEAAYARSGVLLEGSPTQVLTEQRETDTFNIAERNRFFNEQSRIDRTFAQNQYEQDLFGSRITKRGAKSGLFGDVIGTFASAASVKRTGGYKFSDFKII